MRGLFHLLVTFHLRGSDHNYHGRVSTSLSASALGLPLPLPSKKQAELRQKLSDLLQVAEEIGPVGSLASKKDQQRVQELAQALAPYSLPRPALYPLAGEFRLVYSGSSGASSGRLFGTRVSGKVKQYIVDDKLFRNKVTLGPLEMTIKAKREIKNSKELEISLLEATASLFGKQLIKLDMSSADTGMWNYKFVGKTRGRDGKEKLIRIMQAPNLFILEQDLE